MQVPLERRTPYPVQDKKLTAGEYVEQLLTWPVKKGPAAGIVVVLATQRPDSTTIPVAPVVPRPSPPRLPTETEMKGREGSVGRSLAG